LVDLDEAELSAFVYDFSEWREVITREFRENCGNRLDDVSDSGLFQKLGDFLGLAWLEDHFCDSTPTVVIWGFAPVAGVAIGGRESGEDGVELGQVRARPGGFGGSEGDSWSGDGNDSTGGLIESVKDLGDIGGQKNWVNGG
jgi:hypothetical protein